MPTLVSLLSSLQGAFGKPFLLSGLVPGVVLVFGWHGYAESTFIASVLSGEEAVGSFTLIALLELLGVSALLYALNQQIMRAFEDLPGKPFDRLRRFLIDRQRRLWNDANDTLQAALWEQTGATWPTRDFEQEGTFIPVPPLCGVAGGPALSPEECARRSHAARARVHEHALRPQAGGAVPIVHSADLESILHGLRALLEADRGDPGNASVDAEKQAWRELLKQPGAGSVIEEVQSLAYRRVVAALVQVERFPGEGRWLKPTTLGNRIAALDDYAEKRYGMPTTTLWSQLFPHLTSEQSAGAINAQLLVHMLLNVSVAAGLLLALVSLEALAETVRYASRHPGVGTLNVRAVLYVAASAAGAWGAYLAAVSAFDTACDQICRQIDIRRTKVLEGLGYQVPATVAEERVIFEELHEFLESGTGPLDSRPRKLSAGGAAPKSK